ncbi:hypothetical protein D046_0398B, partial [Vibrio parahaemolyticus V-223/04]
RRGHLTHL